MNKTVDDGRCCSFCGKKVHEVAKLIAGPQVFICDECISLCVGIIQSSDDTFFNKIKLELRGNKIMKRVGMKVIDAPDEFWILMDREDIYRNMASAILVKDLDISDNLSERAYNLMEKSRAAGRMAWAIIHEKFPDTDGKQMSAAHGVRKVYIEP